MGLLLIGIYESTVTTVEAKKLVKCNSELGQCIDDGIDTYIRPQVISKLNYIKLYFFYRIFKDYIYM